MEFLVNQLNSTIDNSNNKNSDNKGDLHNKSKFKVKMAPISEKRSQPPNANHVKEMGTQVSWSWSYASHTHTKENASSKASGRVTV
ncbi:unnamed protein product [Ceratitis capitata]|uniref:(Mediterranean fruit fly) hypothetical protein n=1 Tax=Ceratitis capitata TaxID=7213 RepID=A0A811UNA6_CERCA|nr:unnamed protein product [Ceratitis capitata]